ncbi:hypothetical protein PABG_12482 [Paracoccidioides brasiliensis Pb03]|nr:hypothetical protein PABG_12482 [Paracoccidioides brasiliensis Pb03]
MPTESTDQEGRLLLAIEAYETGQNFVYYELLPKTYGGCSALDLMRSNQGSHNTFKCSTF